MIGIVDCNNFYASCERVFDPSVIDRPVVVLSNNDGCVIARSNEAKEIGIEMGALPFEIESKLEEHNVAIFSSNYALYGDMSARVMHTLSAFSPNVEIYSIDEAFLDLSKMVFTDLYDYGIEIKKTVKQYTGIPVGIGIAPSKTLAKAANKYAKKVHRDKGVFVIDSLEKRLEVLKWLPLEDVWGIGHRYAQKLKSFGIKTAYDLSRMSNDFIRYGDKVLFKGMGVNGARLVKELNGISCIPLDLVPQPKQNICTSRSFPQDLTDINDIRAAIATYATRCGEKLRKDKTCAGIIQVFVMTNPFKNAPQYSRTVTAKFKIPTNNTIALVKYADWLLEKHLFKDGYGYKKGGVIVSEIVPQEQVQLNLFHSKDVGKYANIMGVMDNINRTMGQDKARLATCGFGRKWKLKRERLSNCYTTNPFELLKIKI